MGLQVYHSKRKFDVTPEPRGRARPGEGQSVRHPEARRAPAALRPAARARRRDEELGGDARPEPRPGREAARGAGRGSSDRVQQVRGHHPAGRIWRRHRDDLGSRPLVCPKAIRTKGCEKGHLDFTLDGEKLHGRWHLVRMHGRPGEKKEQLAADQGARRGGARRAGSRHSRGGAALGGERPLDRGDRRRQGPEAGLALEPERQGQCEGRRDQG